MIRPSDRCSMYGWRPRALFGAGAVLLVVIALPMCLNGADIIRFKGTVKDRESFQYKVRDDLIFGLDPQREIDPCQGWEIWLGPSDQIKTYAAIVTTPHYHGLIETDICASDFRNSDNSGPNVPGPKNVNRPQRVRQFEFVTNRSDYDAVYKADKAYVGLTLTAEQLSFEVSQYVHAGKVNIRGLSFGNLHVGSQPRIERMNFTVELDLRRGKAR